MAESARSRKKDRMDTLTLNLRTALMQDSGYKTLNGDDYRRVRRVLSILPAKRADMLDLLIDFQNDNGGAGVRRAQLAAWYQDQDWGVGAPVKPLLPYLVKHLESLVAAGIVEKHPSGKGAELLYTVLPGVVRVRREIREDERRRREDERRRREDEQSRADEARRRAEQQAAQAASAPAVAAPAPAVEPASAPAAVAPAVVVRVPAPVASVPAARVYERPARRWRPSWVLIVAGWLLVALVVGVSVLALISGG